MEKQVIIIPTDSNHKSKNMLWSEALKFFDVGDSELKNLIETGEEFKGYCVDEALTYNYKLV